MKYSILDISKCTRDKISQDMQPTVLNSDPLLLTTVAPKLNQGEGKKRAVYRFFLDFLLHFCVKTKVEKNNRLSLV